MMRRAAARTSRAVGALVALVCAAALAGCSGDEPQASSTAPLEVTVGESFTWNDFTVEDGWELTTVERSIGMEDAVVTPRIHGSIVNNSEEERAPLFQLVLSQEGEPQATLNCSAMKLAQEQSAAFECPGLGSIMPAAYDAVTVRELRRDTGESGSGQSGT